MSKRGKKKGSKLPNPLEGLKPTQRRKCGRCGRIRQVRNLTVLYYEVGDIGMPPLEPLICCKEHDPWDFIH